MNVAEQKSHDTSHGWKPINTAPKDKFVLLACPSGYMTTPWVFTTGILHSNYKVGRWVDHANDDLSDWGMSPIFWRDDIITPDSATPAPVPAQEPTKETFQSRHEREFMGRMAGNHGKLTEFCAALESFTHDYQRLYSTYKSYRDMISDLIKERDSLRDQVVKPTQEFNKSVADAEIKALYVESQGTDKGWLGIEGSYFIGGVVAARRQKKATAPAQEVGLTDGWISVGDRLPDGELGYPAIEFYNEDLRNPTRQVIGIYRDGDWFSGGHQFSNVTYWKPLTPAPLAALRAKGGK